MIVIYLGIPVILFMLVTGQLAGLSVLMVFVVGYIFYKLWREKRSTNNL